jgi:putative transcriptional regulator
MEYKIIKAGDIIVSSPYAENGLIFHKSVILIISHDKTGTSGVLVNKLISKVDSNTILKTLNLPIIKGIDFPVNLSVYFGGPIEPEKGILIHSNDYIGQPIARVTEEISISADSKIIADILALQGPKHKMMVLGYAGWRPGQLMDEIKHDDWLVLTNKEEENLHSSNFNLIFGSDDLYKWNKALKLSGIHLSNYAHIPGNA